MADPLTAIAGAQFLMGTFEGFSESEQLKAQARAAKAEGRYGLRKAEFEAAHIARDNRHLQAKQLAAFGANGFQVTGTPADVLAQDAIEGELNVLVKEDEGKRAFAAGRHKASLLKRQARGALLGGIAKGATSALGTHFLAASGTDGAGGSTVPVVESKGVPGLGANL